MNYHHYIVAYAELRTAKPFCWYIIDPIRLRRLILDGKLTAQIIPVRNDRRHPDKAMALYTELDKHPGLIVKAYHAKPCRKAG